MATAENQDPDRRGPDALLLSPHYGNERPSHVIRSEELQMLARTLTYYGRVNDVS